jgi:hypothetical protein
MREANSIAGYEIVALCMVGYRCMWFVCDVVLFFVFHCFLWSVGVYACFILLFSKYNA